MHQRDLERPGRSRTGRDTAPHPGATVAPARLAQRQVLEVREASAWTALADADLTESPPAASAPGRTPPPPSAHRADQPPCGRPSHLGPA
jgi:hypothetical protein